jgi:hypothetical protein
MSDYKYFSLLVCVLCFQGHAVFAEVTRKIDFTVYVGTTKAGMLLITRQEVNEKISYHLHSEVSVKLLAGIDIEENIQDVFVNGLLHESEHTRFINASQRIRNSLRYTQQRYVLSKNDKVCGYLTTPIRTSVTSLYFMEPTLPVQVYSQSFQKLITLKRIGIHSYAQCPHSADSNVKNYKDSFPQDKK